MSNLMSAAEDLGDQLRVLRGAFADDEEGRAGSVLVEQVENLRRVAWVGAVVDREPYFACRGREPRERPAHALRRRHEQVIQHEQITAEESDGGSEMAKRK